MNNTTDPRIRDFIGLEGNANKPFIQMIGFPSDEGVKRNGGRPGASGAPALILQQLGKLTPHPGYFDKHTDLLKQLVKPELITCSGDVEQDQERLGKTVAQCLEKNQIPVILGGGHETTFGHFLGYAETGQSVSIVNIDAHADVRELKEGKAHSGSPFRQALEHPSKACTGYHAAGLNPASAAKSHLDYVNQYGTARLENELTLQSVHSILEECKYSSVLATMDMDVVHQGSAPGVSAPNSSGISAELWLEIAFEFGRHPAVTSFDLCEVNPEFDRDHQTVKLAALTIWYFLLGMALR